MPTLLATTPPSLTVNWFPPPEWPTRNSPLLFQREPAPVTTATLLLASGLKPRKPALLATTAPLLTTSWFPLPLLPTRRMPLLVQREPAPVTSATLLFASKL